MEVDVPVLPNAPHDSSNLMKTENAAQNLLLLNEEEELDLLKEILSKDMEEFDKEEGGKEENKETNIMSCLLVAMTDLQKLMIEQNQLLTSLNTGLRKNTYHHRQTSLLPKKCRKKGKGSKVVSI